MPISKITGKKKDGKQAYRVRINYTDSSGAYKQTERVVYGSAEAQLAEAQLRAKLDEGESINKKMTVEQLKKEYISVKASEVRATTLDKADRVLSRYVVATIGTTRLDKLTPSALQKWKNDIIALGLSVTTNKGIYRDLKAMLKYSVRMDYLQKNPLDSVGNFKDAYFTAAPETLHYYTPEQFIKYIAISKAQSERINTLTEWGYYVFFNVAFYTGMRKGEINALKWTDIDGDIIHVRRSVSQKIKGASITETPPKNKSSYRDLQIPLPLLDILNAHKARQQCARGFTDDWRVCGGPDCLRDTTIEVRNTEYAKSAELEHIRIHDFRHTHASVLVNEGINIQEIARRLGHSKIEITWNTYSHLYPREEERAVNILNKIRG